MVSTHNRSGGKLIIHIKSFQSHIPFPQRESCTSDSKSIFIGFSISYDHVENQNLIMQVPKQRHPHLQILAPLYSIQIIRLTEILQENYLYRGFFT